MTLIETKQGERQLVASLDGLGELGVDYTIIAEDVPPPSHGCARLDENNQWVVDEDREREASIRAAGEVGRFAELEARLAAAEATIMVMAPLVEQASGISLDSGEPLAPE